MMHRLRTPASKRGIIGRPTPQTVLSYHALFLLLCSAYSWWMWDFALDKPIHAIYQAMATFGCAVMATRLGREQLAGIIAIDLAAVMLLANGINYVRLVHKWQGIYEAGAFQVPLAVVLAFGCFTTLSLLLIARPRLREAGPVWWWPTPLLAIPQLLVPLIPSRRRHGLGASNRMAMIGGSVLVLCGFGLAGASRVPAVQARLEMTAGIMMNDASLDALLLDLATLDSIADATRKREAAGRPPGMRGSSVKSEPVAGVADGAVVVPQSTGMTALREMTRSGAGPASGVEIVTPAAELYLQVSRETRGIRTSSAGPRGIAGWRSARRPSSIGTWDAAVQRQMHASSPTAGLEVIPGDPSAIDAVELDPSMLEGIDPRAARQIIAASRDLGGRSQFEQALAILGATTRDAGLVRSGNIRQRVEQFTRIGGTIALILGIALLGAAVTRRS